MDAEEIKAIFDRKMREHGIHPDPLGLPSVDVLLDLRKFALSESVKSGYVADPPMMLGFLTQPFLDPIVDLLRACYQVFLAQDMGDHVAVFDRATDMRDAFGSVLKVMDELGINRPGGDAESWMVKKQGDDGQKGGA